MPRAAALLAAVLALPAVGRAARTTPGEITRQVICQCGCQQTVSACNHYMCSSRTEMQAMAEQEAATGKSATAVLQDFVLRYGVQVLATPPARGFDLTVWILPGTAFLVGLTLVLVVVRRWRRRAAPAPAAAELDPRLVDAVEEEMKSLGR